MVKVWRTIRVFISSTFRDMHAERDYLARVVFPELRERCSKRQLHLVDLDLRWGVTEKEAEQGKVLEVIFNEIDRSRPFFIAIIGERYGSIPEMIPEDAKYEFPWLHECSDHSLTALEIIHGVLRNPELAQRSFFYFRDPQVVTQIPESKRADFAAEDPERARKLSALKEKIRTSGRPAMEKYPCRWDDNKGRLVDLDVLGQRIREDLWTAICAEYPEETLELDLLSIDRQMHDAFAEEHSLHVGRLEETARLTRYIQSIDRRPVVITGESGCGKSAFLANWYRQYAAEHPDDFVLAYFIGASPDSTNHHKLLRNMCGELKRRFVLAEEIPKDDERLSEALAAMLTAASCDERTGAFLLDRLRHRLSKPKSGRRIVIVLDALNQLLPLEAAYGLGWLLDYIPENVRLVVSSLESDCLNILRHRGAEEITLSPLNVREQQQIVQTLLGKWRRKLDDRQLAALLAHQMVKNPLYLRVALEELRLFGEYEQLTERIKALAEDLRGLFDQVLSRLEDDHGHELVAEAFAMLGCSRHGLSEAELLDLLCRQEQEQLPRVLWTRLALNARAYLVQRGEFLGFFHQQLGDAVAARYLDRKRKHAKLAVYFERAPIERKLDEYPYQLYQSDQQNALSEALSNLEFFEYAYDNGHDYEWMWYWRSLEKVCAPGDCYKQSVDALMEKGGGDPQSVASLLDKIGFFLEDMTDYLSALVFHKRALEIRERTQDPNTRDVATSLNALAVVYHKQGVFAEALPLYKRALEIRERTLDPNHPDVATSLCNLADLYLNQGVFAEALPLFKRALEIRERTLDPNHPDVATSLCNLGALYYEQRMFAEALPLLKRALEIRERTQDPNTKDVAQSLNNLAALYREQGKLAEALNLHQRSLAVLERALGPNNPYVATSLDNLGVVYLDQKMFAEALPLLKRALEIRERTLDPNHPDVATSLDNLADLYLNQGVFAEALPLYKRALKIYESAFGPNHPQTAAYLTNLAVQYHEQGMFAEALPLLKRALEIRERTLDPNHPDVATSLNALAVVYYKQGMFAEALPLFKRALKSNEDAFGPNHPQTALCHSYLADLYRRQGMFAEALNLHQRSLAVLERALGPNHPDVVAILNNLGVVYLDQKMFAEALPLFKRALKSNEDAFGPNHPQTAPCLSNLADLYRRQGKFCDAVPLYRRSLQILRRYDSNNPQIKRIERNLKACEGACAES